ncbi:MAG: FtsW/RodA/SpoVE family cell cycle protein, partial [Comamonas sp.]
MWSLSVEEHFYLIWPPLLVLLLRKTQAGKLWRPILLLWVLSTLWRLFWVGQGQHFYEIFFRFDTRASGLLAGSLLAALVIEKPSWIRALQARMHHAMWLPLAIPLLMRLEWDNQAVMVWGLTVVECAALVLLVAVLIPHVGTVVNGARRWLSLGIMNFQPSELAKFAVLIYAADYMVRKMAVKERFFRAVLPMGAAVVVVGVLLLAEPDMGAFMVIVVIAMGILFLGGVNARMFFLIAFLVVVAFVIIIGFSEWRRERIFAYLNPWDEKHALGKG